ncbi:uncharacterized protein KQ657_001835 [Scheffersomyces spartinae]|uniref:CFEM domain-containing protein n=1 Tax=Scheffersomyces spartinae TaxID=45513 RepID=A0A9P8AHR9_9ASCO|nr:uncharacterized protein KQ657_001835 [Scheffersomyces spartinae]KAG7192434.1 hypothetical protein KQ657_001835 [Scheffersomyces spartinae]
MFKLTTLVALASVATTVLATPPACLLACVSKVEQDSKCSGLNDLSCICGDNSSAVEKCLKSICPDGSADAAVSAFEDSCSGYSINKNESSSSEAASSTASSSEASSSSEAASSTAASSSSAAASSSSAAASSSSAAASSSSAAASSTSAAASSSASSEVVSSSSTKAPTSSVAPISSTTGNVTIPITSNPAGGAGANAVGVIAAGFAGFAALL